MRIISKVKDYYDGIMAYAPVEEPIFVREYREIYHNDLPKNILEKVDSYLRIPIPDGFDIFYIFFCGRMYVRFLSDDPAVEGTLDYNSAVALLDTKYYKDKPQRYYWEDPRKTFKIVDSKLKQHQFDDKLSIPVSVDLFQYFNAPYFIVRKHSWRETITVHVNGSLSDVSFFKVFDPFTTFQEISMYLGNFLTEPDIAPTTVGDDKIIAQQKGFDEYSFRSIPPGEAKARRRQNRLRKRGLI